MSDIRNKCKLECVCKNEPEMGCDDDFCIRHRAYKKGRADGYSQAETDYYKQTEKDRQSAYDCGYENGRQDAIEELVEMLTNDWGLDIILAQSNKEKLKSFIVSNGEQLKEKKE